MLMHYGFNVPSSIEKSTMVSQTTGMIQKFFLVEYATNHEAHGSVPVDVNQTDSARLVTSNEISRFKYSLLEYHLCYHGCYNVLVVY